MGGAIPGRVSRAAGASRPALGPRSTGFEVFPRRLDAGKVLLGHIQTPQKAAPIIRTLGEAYE
jgi:hypothetical protein